MRVNFSYVVTVFVALSFVSGIVGCQSNGGPWYNPKSYSLANPFSNKENAPPYSPSALANKPSVDAQPNVNTPPGGYTDKAFANRSGSPGGTVSTSPPEHWSQQSPMVSQGSPNPYGGYTVPEPSQYLPYDGQGSASPYHYAAPQQQNPSPYQYSPETVQQAGSSMPNSMPYGVDYASGGVPGGYQPTASHVSTSNSNYGMNPPPGGYPLGGIPQNDPYTVGLQQPQQAGAVQQPQPGFSVYDQSVPASYQGENTSATAYPQQQPYYQPYQPPTAGSGHNYNY